MTQLVKTLSIISLLAYGAFSQALTQPASPTKQPEKAAKVETEDPRYASKKTPVHVPLITTAPPIDDVLNDEVWQTAPVFGDFLQTQPGDNVAPTHPTEFMMAFDSKNLYMAFRVKQDRNNVRATVARRDNIFNDDYV